MNSVKLSFVIPTYNAERTIALCIESIIESMIPSPELIYEIIVVNNNCTDSTAEILKKFNIINIFETRQGRSFSRNSGILKAKGKYVAFIDADVYLSSSWAQCLIELFKLDSVGGVQGKIIPCQKFGSESLNQYRYWSIGSDTNSTFCLPRIKAAESPMINSAACLYLREALLKVNNFDEGLERHEDIDLAKRVMLAGFNLAVDENAVAMVIFHGSGWWDYFRRSFADGFYKNKYLYRWNNFYQRPNGHVFLKNTYSFFNQVTYYFSKAFAEENYFWFVKIALLFFNTLGRVCGGFYIKFCHVDLKEISFPLGEKIRYIFFSDGHYQIDTGLNVLTDCTSRNAINKNEKIEI